MGMVPIYAFLRHSGKVPDFHSENSATCHLTFTIEIRHRFAFNDMDYNDHIERGQAGIYIHTLCTMQAHRAGKKMPTSLEHGPKYKCRKINRGVQENKQGSPYSRNEDEWYTT